jgi:prevent-host-death family protein
MPAGEFKARCLAVLDDVAISGREVIITKRGRPVAKLVPVGKPSEVPIEGLIVHQGDLIAPIDVDWNAES